MVLEEVRFSQFFELLSADEGLKELCLNHCDVMVNEELCVAVRGAASEKSCGFYGDSNAMGLI
jgi:hypothetical protein